MSGSDQASTLENIRICFIAHDSIGATGTASKYFYPLIAAQSGAEVAVIGDWSGEAPSMPSGVEVFDLSMEGGARVRSKDVRAIVQRLRPDVVHVFFHRGCGWYRRYCADLGARWIIDVRGPLLATGMRRKVSRLLNKLEVIGYDAVAGHSKGSISTVFGPRATRKAYLTRIGVTVKRFAPRPRRSGSPFRFVYLGGIDRKRRLETMLRGYALASKRAAITLDLIGDGNDAESLKLLIAREAIEGVRFIGHLPHTEVSEKLVEYDAAISYMGPSVYDSGPPLKTLEYFAAGLPVVASGTKGNRMLMEGGVEGVFDNGRTAESLADAILQLMSSDMGMLSANARRRADSCAWQGIVTADLSNLYSRILE